MQSLTSYFARCGLAFLGTLGALELAATFVSTMVARRPAEGDALYAALRIALAVLVSITVLARSRTTAPANEPPA